MTDTIETLETDETPGLPRDSARPVGKRERRLPSLYQLIAWYEALGGDRQVWEPVLPPRPEKRPNLEQMRRYGWRRRDVVQPRTPLKRAVAPAYGLTADEVEGFLRAGSGACRGLSCPWFARHHDRFALYHDRFLATRGEKARGGTPRQE